MTDETGLPGMAALVLPCWVCWGLAQQTVHTVEGLREFHRFGPLCTKCQERIHQMTSMIDTIASAVKQYSEPVVTYSGKRILWLLDVLELGSQFSSFMLALRPQYQLAGIELGGALLARAHSSWAGVVRKRGQVYMPKTPPWLPAGKVSLVDDVVTTGKSLELAEVALNMAGYEVGERLCVLDRRFKSKRDLLVRSLVTAEDLGLSVVEPSEISSYLY